MKIKLSKILTVILLFPLLIFGNMAQPWVDGSEHSTLYGAKNCQVINENIFIHLIKQDDVYIAKYKIKYIIHSNVNQTIPLLFIGIGLSEEKLVLVNNKETLLKKYIVNNNSEISYSKNDNISVNKDDLIYFEANLTKGENTIIVEYNASLEYNTIGFIRTYKLKYSLYPSQFWESFGDITVKLFLDDNLKIKSSNIGEPKIEDNTVNWVIKTIEKDTIELEITRKISRISEILLYIEPFGIAIACLILMFLYHLKILIKKHKQKNFKNIILYSGIIIIPILHYVIYFLSFDLIDFSLGQKNSKHGYVFLYLFTLPILILLYGIIMWIINRVLKSKYEK